MNRLIFILSLLCLGLGVGMAEAFTLIGIGGTCSEEIAKACDSPATVEAKECCKCHKPCITGAEGTPTPNPDLLECLKNKGTCPNTAQCVPPSVIDECKTDLDCEKDGNICTAPKCEKFPISGKCPEGTAMADGSTSWSGTVGKCQVPETPVANCTPPTKDCGDLFPLDPEAQRCCKEFGLTDPAENKCCVEHISHEEPVKDPATGKLIPCNGKDCPKCPDCPPPPKVDCSLIGDPKIKDCCIEKGGLLWFMLDKCVEDGPGGKDDCNIVINAGGDFINSGQMNICCQVVNNTGEIKDTTISQACSNTTGGGPGGSTTGGIPTTPSGSAASLTCSVALSGAPVDGKFAISYTVPSSAGPVVSATLTQLSGSQIKVEGESEPADFGAPVTSPKSMSTKTISDPNNPPVFTVYAPTPKSMVGEWKAPFEVKVSLATLDGEVGSAVCVEDHFLHAEGTGCGCNMTASLTTREQMFAYAVVMMFLGLPFAALRWARFASKKKEF